MGSLTKQTRLYWQVSRAVAGHDPGMTVGKAIGSLRSLLWDLSPKYTLYKHASRLQQQLITGDKQNVN